MFLIPFKILLNQALDPFINETTLLNIKLMGGRKNVNFKSSAK